MLDPLPEKKNDAVPSSGEEIGLGGYSLLQNNLKKHSTNNVSDAMCLMHDIHRKSKTSPDSKKAPCERSFSIKYQFSMFSMSL
jgi:hypothetical protein